MPIPSNGITPEVIRSAMPPYHFNPDLLAATIAALPAPPPDSTTAWRQARLTRLLQEIDALKPADAAQARIAAQILTTRELADAFTARAHAPNLEINQMCRLGRTAAELHRSADRLDRTLARHQQMPVSFYGTVIPDQVDIPALETTWASRIPASASADAQAPADANVPASAEAHAPTGTTATAPPPATPQPAIARRPENPPPDPAPPTPQQLQAPPDQSPDPATLPDQPPASPLTRPAGPNWVFEHLDQGPGWTREVLRPRTKTDPVRKPAA
jgi:hypothetical protein